MNLILILVALIVIGLLYAILHKTTKDLKTGGGRGTETAVILILKTPIGVQEMRKKYIKTDNQPPHITLGYLYPDFDERRVLTHLRSLKPEPIVFTKWKHTKTFIALIPSNVDEIKKIIGPMERDIENGPRGGFHMSLAYRPKSAPLDKNTHNKAHDMIKLPLVCPVKGVEISRRKPGGEWRKYKSVNFE